MKNERGTFRKIGDTLWFHLEGRTYTFSANPGEGSPSRGRSSAVLQSGLLKSPMPGKILNVPVTVGEKVTAGKTVCIIEAMKMEYALKSPFEGVIKTVFKSKGQLVQLDESVVEIEKEAGKNGAGSK